MNILKFQQGMNAYQTDGLHSYSETLAFIVAEIYSDKKLLPLFEKQNEDMGLIERLNICIAYAKEFEQIHEGREWDGEYYDEIEYFINSKISTK